MCSPDGYELEIHNCAGRVEMWRGGLGGTYLLAGPFVCRCLTSTALLHFHVPLLEPDVRIARIRLSFRLSGLRVRHVCPTSGNLVQPQRLVEIGQGVSFVPCARTLFPSHQPSAETLFGVEREPVSAVLLTL